MLCLGITWSRLNLSFGHYSVNVHILLWIAVTDVFVQPAMENQDGLDLYIATEFADRCVSFL